MHNMHWHDPLQKRIASFPCPPGLISEAINFIQPQGRERSGKAGSGPRRHHQLQSIGKILSACRRGFAPNRDRQPVLGIFDYLRTVQPQQFQIAVEIGRRDKKIQGVVRRK